MLAHKGINTSKISASGGIITTYGHAGKSYVVHTFKSNGTFRIYNKTLSCDILLVGGGGGGGMGGDDAGSNSDAAGGGGAGLIVWTMAKSLVVGEYTMTIAATSSRQTTQNTVGPTGNYSAIALVGGSEIYNAGGGGGGGRPNTVGGVGDSSRGGSGGGSGGGGSSIGGASGTRGTDYSDATEYFNNGGINGTAAGNSYSGSGGGGAGAAGIAGGQGSMAGSDGGNGVSYFSSPHALTQVETKAFFTAADVGEFIMDTSQPPDVFRWLGGGGGGGGGNGSNSSWRGGYGGWGGGGPGANGNNSLWIGGAGTITTGADGRPNTGGGGGACGTRGGSGGTGGSGVIVVRSLIQSV